MGQPSQTKKDMMEVSSPLKPSESPTTVEVHIKENMSLADVIKIRGKGHSKKLARENNKAQHSNPTAQTKVSGIKRPKKIQFVKEEETFQKRRCMSTHTHQAEPNDGSAVAAMQHHWEP